jgi:hypothetical protein
VHLPTTWGSELLISSSDDVALLNTGGEDVLAVGAETALWLKG